MSAASDKQSRAKANGVALIAASRKAIVHATELSAHARAAHQSADAEREVLWVLNGHCNSPIAGFSTIEGEQMTLTASVLDEAGDLFIEASRSGPADRPRELGRAVALDLLAKGAAEIIERSRPK